jgi:hypothetical protein
MIKPPRESCYNLCRIAHDAIKWIGGDCYEHGGKIVTMRDALLENENVEKADKDRVYNKIERIRKDLYAIEKILAEYEI